MIFLDVECLKSLFLIFLKIIKIYFVECYFPVVCFRRKDLDARLEVFFHEASGAFDSGDSSVMSLVFRLAKKSAGKPINPSNQ